MENSVSNMSENDLETTGSIENDDKESSVRVAVR